MISSNVRGVLLQREIPKNISFQRGTIQSKVMFNSAGAPITSGIFDIQSEKEKYKVTIYIGKGRIKIEKV